MGANEALKLERMTTKRTKVGRVRRVESRRRFRRGRRIKKKSNLG